jgi:hypothetical protein
VSLLDTSKANYGGTYRAVCLEVLPDRVRVQVPQIFATAVVTIFEFAGPRPAEGDEGWVSFESGLAERPIWIGSEAHAEIPLGGDAGDVLTRQLDGSIDWDDPQAQFTGFTRCHNTTSPDTTLAMGVGVTEIALARVLNEQGPTFAPNANNNRFTVPVAGSYDLAAYVSAPSTPWPSNAVVIFLLVNGIPVARENPSNPTAMTAFESRTISTCRWLEAGDQVSLAFYTNTTTTIRLMNAAATLDPIQPYLSVWRTGSGPPGTGLRVKGTVANQAALALGGNALNDTYVTLDTQMLYVWNGTAWVNAGPVVGGSSDPLANYFYGTTATAAGVSSSFSGVSWQTEVMANGFARQGGGASVNIVVARAGRYRVASQISGTTAGTAGIWRQMRIALFSSQAVLKVTRDTVNPGTPANQWGTYFGEAVLDCDVGDLIQIQVASDSPTTIDSAGRNWVEITPIGGTKGDPGPAGPDVTMLQSSYFYGQGASPGTAPANAETILNWTQLLNNGIGFTSGGGNIVFNSPGKYRVAFQCSGTLVTTNAATAFDSRIKHYSSAGVLKLSRGNVPSAPATAGWWSMTTAEAIIDAAAGDFVQCAVQPNGAFTLDMTRSWVEVTPIGGTKGDKGDTGMPGSATDASDFWYGIISGPFSVLGNDVPTYASWTTLNSSSGFSLASAGQRITAARTGRYHVTAQMTYSCGANAAFFTRIYINHFSAAAVLKSQEHAVGSGAPAGSYIGAVADGVFDVVAGDYFAIQGTINNTTGVFNDHCFVSVVPVGGAKGDQGPPGSAVGTTAWTALPFAAGWSNYPSGYQLCQYRLEGDRVFLRGLCQQTTLANLNVANLPAGFRPPGQTMLHTMAFSSTPKDHIQRIEIYTTGALTIITPAVNELQGYMTLDGLSWSTAT